jgi:hypothetical protein
MTLWFVPPTVATIAMAVLLVALTFYRQFIGA